jgi:hypothetical protein
VFDIAFLHEDPVEEEDDETGLSWLSLPGMVTLGEYTERFLAPIPDWSRQRYQQQWLEAATRLVEGCERTGFFTVSFQFWWTMWQFGEAVLVHEQIFRPYITGELFDIRNPYAVIEDYRRFSDDGTPVSEWRVTAAAIREFIIRRSSEYAAA